MIAFFIPELADPHLDPEAWGLLRGPGRKNLVCKRLATKRLNMTLGETVGLQRSQDRGT